MRSLVGMLLALVPVVYLALIGIGWERNRVAYEFQVFFGDAVLEQPLGLLVVGAFLLGVSLTSLVFSWPILRVRLRLRRESKRVAQLEQEVHGLRTLPLTEDHDAKAVEAREA